MFQSKIATILRKQYEDLEETTFEMLFSNDDGSEHIGMNDDNESKNRYLNILPAKETMLEGAYINANLVQHLLLQQFIATQAPLPNTFDDFYRMVYENSDVIVMVTNWIESRKNKADNYLPSSGEILETENFFVLSVSKITILKELDITQLVLVPKSQVASKEEFIKQTNLFVNRPRDLFNKQRRQLQSPYKCIAHYHLRCWPDLETPETLVLFHEFLLLTRKATCPVVHCSAGVGRTGAFIVCYWLYEQKRSNKLDGSRSVSVPVIAPRDHRLCDSPIPGAVESSVRCQDYISGIGRSPLAIFDLPTQSNRNSPENSTPVQQQISHNYHRHNQQQRLMQSRSSRLLALFNIRIQQMTEQALPLGEVNELVLSLRKQRSYAMVQTLQQYRFIFEYAEYLEVLFDNQI